MVYFLASIEENSRKILPSHSKHLIHQLHIWVAVLEVV